MGSTPELDFNEVSQKSWSNYLGQDANTNPMWDQANKYSGMADQQANMANLLFGGAGYGTKPSGASSNIKDPTVYPYPTGTAGGNRGSTRNSQESPGSAKGTPDGTATDTPDPLDPPPGGTKPIIPPWYATTNKDDPYTASPVTTNNGQIETPTGGLYGGYTSMANGDRTADEQKVGGVYSGMIDNPGYSNEAKAAMQQSAASALSGQNSAAQDSMRRRMATTGNAAGGYGAMARLSGTNAATASNQARSNVIDWENKKQQDQLQGAAGMSSYNQQGQQQKQYGLAGLQNLFGSANQMSAGYYGALRDLLGTKRLDTTTIDTQNQSYAI